MFRRRTGLALSLSLTTAFAAAGFAAVGAQQVKASFELPSDQPVLEYRLEIGQLEVEDNAKWIKVFADGRGLVHIPGFMRGGGDYAFQMTPGEVEELARFAVGKGLVDFDTSEVKREKAEVVRRFRERREAAANSASSVSGSASANAEEEQDPGLRAIYDAPLTVIELHLDAYRPAQEAGPTGGPAFGSRVATIEVDRQIRWYALRWDAEWFPEVEALTRLADVEQRLEALFDRPDLMPVGEDAQ